MNGNLPLALRVWFWMTCAVSLAGCGPGTAASVSGKVTLDGSPLDDATISFIPMVGGQQQAAWASIKGGQYAIADQEGLGTGQFRVEIRALRSLGDNQNDPTRPTPAKEIVPNRYNSKSELTADIKAGQNVANFELKAK